MKKLSRINLLLIGILALSILMAGCNKDEDEPAPTPQPENPKAYMGTTDQDLAARFGTAEIGGLLYLVSFNIDLIYHDTVNQSTHQASMSKASNSGIVQFNGTSFQYDQSDLSMSGALDNGDATLSGTYTWKYDGVNTYSGTYNTVKQ